MQVVDTKKAGAVTPQNAKLELARQNAQHEIAKHLQAVDSYATNFDLTKETIKIISFLLDGVPYSEEDHARIKEIFTSQIDEDFFEPNKALIRAVKRVAKPRIENPQDFFTDFFKKYSHKTFEGKKAVARLVRGDIIFYRTSAYLVYGGHVDLIRGLYNDTIYIEGNTDEVYFDNYGLREYGFSENALREFLYLNQNIIGDFVRTKPLKIPYLYTNKKFIKLDDEGLASFKEMLLNNENMLARYASKALYYPTKVEKPWGIGGKTPADPVHLIQGDKEYTLKKYDTTSHFCKENTFELVDNKPRKIEGEELQSLMGEAKERLAKVLEGDFIKELAC